MLFLVLAYLSRLLSFIGFLSCASLLQHAIFRSGGLWVFAAKATS